MQFSVEPWSIDYGSSFDMDVEAENGHSDVDVGIECGSEAWAPVTPQGAPARTVTFVDGVQRTEARVWIRESDLVSRMAICASYAAGAVRCSEAATVDGASVQVARGVFGPASVADIDCGHSALYKGILVADSTPSGLDVRLRRQREDLEVYVAHKAGPADLLVVDGHVRQRESIAGAVGYLKSHQVQYLPAGLAAVVGRLSAGQRTPVFLIETPWSRYSWYLKLPGGEGHAWAGVVRCEASPSLKPGEVIQFADFVSVTLPRFASAGYKDPRAPQNLYPVAGLERELRRRLGDPALLLRALQRASLAR